MIDWALLATKLGYADEVSMWQDLYTAKGLSVKQLSKKLDISRNTVRLALEDSGIEMRPRGGPNNKKLDITDALVEEIRQKGISAVAKELGLSYTTVYKRLYRVRGLTVTALQAQPIAVPATAEGQADAAAAEEPTSGDKQLPIE
jgi:transposase